MPYRSQRKSEAVDAVPLLSNYHNGIHHGASSEPFEDIDVSEEGWPLNPRPDMAEYSTADQSDLESCNIKKMPLLDSDNQLEQYNHKTNTSRYSYQPVHSFKNDHVHPSYSQYQIPQQHHNMHLRRPSLTLNLPDPTCLMSCCTKFEFLQNPRSCKQDEYDSGSANYVRIPYPWTYIRLFQVALGLFFIITFVIHTKEGGSWGVWPIIIIGAVTMAYALLMFFMRVHRRYKATLINMTLFVSFVDLLFASTSIAFNFWMSDNHQYHWHQCRFYFWGRSCRMQRYADAATFLNFWSFCITAYISLHTVYRLYFKNKAAPSTPYSQLASAPDQYFNKFSIRSLFRIKRQKKETQISASPTSSSPRSSSSSEETINNFELQETSDFSIDSDSDSVRTVTGDSGQSSSRLQKSLDADEQV